LEKAVGIEPSVVWMSRNNHGPDDYDFPWTMAEAGAVFCAIKDPLYLYRRSSGEFIA